jgi:hypothetical protein
VEKVFFYIASSAVVAGIWWIVLSGLMAVAIRPLRWVLVPFANHLRRVHALWLTALGLIVAGSGAAILIRGV